MIVNTPDKTSNWYSIWLFILIALTAFAAISTLTIPAAFPAIFMARANGLFAYYRYQTLDFVLHTNKGHIAGFWIRYLAALIDGVVLAAMWGVLWSIFGLAFVVLVVRFGMYGMLPILLIVTSLVSWWGHYRYYVRSELGNSQGTFGKSSLGLIVTDMEGNKITVKTARSRYFTRTFVTQAIPFYLGYLMVAFTPKKQALHDALTKTIVVWEGDRND
jgi:uncharacterized RDD family membrane protein YckC